LRFFQLLAQIALGESGGPTHLASAAVEPLGLGGPTNDGTVYEFVSATQSLVTLATFDGTNGSQPEGGLIRDANGIFYGTTLGGGAYGDGSVFKFDPSTGVVTTLASFNGGDLTGPMGGLVFGADGNLYGTTWGGGDNGMGTVFEVSVPEPGSLSIIAASALGVLVHRRHSISGDEVTTGMPQHPRLPRQGFARRTSRQFNPPSRNRSPQPVERLSTRRFP